MDSTAWFRYFDDNQARADASPPGGVTLQVAPELRAALIRSLQRFHLGEAGEGRVAHEAAISDDPALDPETKAAIRLYVREEGRHAREVAATLRALGARTLGRHWSEAAFRRGRRLLGLRTKMMTIGAAEVVGIVFYGLLRDHAPCAEIRRLGAALAEDEQRHLEFQADWFARVIARTPLPWRIPYTALLGGELALLLGAATGVFAVDHAPLFRALGLRSAEVLTACLRVAGEALTRVVDAGVVGSPRWSMGAVLE